ncbi:hypothetical protein J6590_095173, partial [Homalodisca vitripennis]
MLGVCPQNRDDGEKVEQLKKLLAEVQDELEELRAIADDHRKNWLELLGGGRGFSGNLMKVIVGGGRVCRNGSGCLMGGGVLAASQGHCRLPASFFLSRSAPRVPRLDGKLHLMGRDAKGHQCHVCYKKYLRKETINFCKTCVNKPFLHPDSCFEAYHNMEDYVNG